MFLIQVFWKFEFVVLKQLKVDSLEFSSLRMQQEYKICARYVITRLRKDLELNFSFDVCSLGGHPYSLLNIENIDNKEVYVIFCSNRTYKVTHIVLDSRLI